MAREGRTTGGLPPIRLRSETTAAPEAVYDLLADLRSHLVWGGERQSSGFRLLTMNAPPDGRPSAWSSGPRAPTASTG